MDSCADVDLVEPIITKNGTYENPFKTWTGLPSFSQGFKMLSDRIRNGSERMPNETVLKSTLPVEMPDFNKLSDPPTNKIQYMWIGHASCLVQMDGVTLLTDPIWSQRCSFVQFLGPKRYRQPPCSIAQLPKIDAVVISHNHYDHLDKATVYELNARFGARLKWFVPMGLRSWFTRSGCENVTELSWWQSAPISKSVEVVCTPAQHWSLRNGCDRNQSLWCSWVLKSADRSFFFSGDTGYCDVFEAIGTKYGPFNLAAIAIGAYCPRYFMKAQHVDPEQAYKIHNEIKSRLSFGIHWGTFSMGSTEPYLEPKQLIQELQKEEPNPTFITVNHGAVLQAD